MKNTDPFSLKASPLKFVMAAIYFTTTVSMASVPLHHSPSRVAETDQHESVFNRPGGNKTELSGEKVAEKITARYLDIETACQNEEADFYCRGVLLRVTDADKSFHSWNPSRASTKRNGVSFYYLNKGGGITELGLSGVGLIFSELQASKKYTLDVRCAYPSNGYSDARTDSCNARRGYPKSRPCDEQGITTVDRWVAHYSNSGNGKYQCGFKTDKQQFSLSQEVRNYFPKPRDKSKGNEIVVAAWDQNIPEQLALDAIFYQRDGDIPKAQLIQNDYFEQTGSVLPILHVDLTLPDDEKFVYVPSVQKIPNKTLTTKQ